MSYWETETDRRVSNLIRIGSIAALDEAAATVTVDLGDITTAPLPWLTTRAGPDRTWWAPEPGEQVLVLSPSGDLAQGVVMPAIYQDAHPAPANSRTISRTEYADGSVVEYDREAHRMTVSVGSGQVVVICQTATVQASESVTLDTPDTHCTGNLTVQRRLTYLGGMAGSNVNGGNGAAAVIQGDFQAAGGVFTHNGKDVGSTHKHANSGGSGTGGEPI